MNNNDLNNQLRVMAGGGVVMDTSQLAMALSMNPKVISKMRQEGRFPIQHKLIGTKIVYPIATVAKFLLSDDPEPVVQPKVGPRTEPEKRRTKTAQAPIPDFSRKMLVRALVSTLEEQVESMERLILFFDRKAKAEELDSTLPRKEGKASSRKVIKT